jgi:hypothetical protein
MEVAPMTDEEREPRTNPSAPVSLMLRFETSIGPRTVIVPMLTVETALAVKHEMLSAGHYAEFVDAVKVSAIPMRKRRGR